MIEEAPGQTKHRARSVGAVALLALGLLFLVAGVVTAPARTARPSPSPQTSAVLRRAPSAHVFLAQSVIAASPKSIEQPLPTVTEAAVAALPLLLTQREAAPAPAMEISAPRPVPLGAQTGMDASTILLSFGGLLSGVGAYRLTKH